MQIAMGQSGERGVSGVQGRGVRLVAMLIVAIIANGSLTLAPPASASSADPANVAWLELKGVENSLHARRDIEGNGLGDTSAAVGYLKTCRKAAKRFFRLANKKKFRQAKKMTFHRADMRRVRNTINQGFRFKLRFHCSHAGDMPEGYSTSSTLLYDGAVAGSVWTHADGPKGKPKKWKFWDIWPVAGE